MTKGMVERVATTMARHENGMPSAWKLYADDARFALRAMETPTHDMVLAAAAAAEKAGAGDHVAIWKAMIAAALAEPVQPIGRDL